MKFAEAIFISKMVQLYKLVQKRFIQQDFRYGFEDNVNAVYEGSKLEAHG